MGRALDRECGPSQDRDPDPGNLPFLFLCLFFLFRFKYFPFFDDLLVFVFYTKPIITLKCLFILVFSLHFINELFIPLIGKFTRFLHS